MCARGSASSICFCHLWCYFLSTAVVVSTVPSEYTFFRFDVDEETARWLLSSVPGVTPLPPDEAGDASEDETEAVENDAVTSAVGDDERLTDEEVGVTDGRPAGYPVTEVPLDEPTSSDQDRSRATFDVGPSTPWPGAPTDEDESDGGWRDRLSGKRVAIAAGLVLALGVVGVAAVWFLKKRGKTDGKEADEGRWSGSQPSDSEATATESGPDRSSDRRASDDTDSRSYPVDVSPLVGIGFLSVVALVLRRYRSSDDT